jgi:hypothetical protein
MRSSILSRSVVAVASLAIGSVALAAVPATAATPSGITREAVLSLASAARADNGEPSLATRTAAAAMLNRECGVASDQVLDASTVREVSPVNANAPVDGVYITASVTSQGTPVRECAIGVVAPVVAGSSLSGTATLSTSSFGSTQTTTATPTALSGDVSVITLKQATLFSVSFTYKAEGASTKTTSTTTSVKVKDTKTKAQKKAAKKKYVKRLKAAKKTFKKAERKADSKAQKVKAKKAYKARRAAAKA